MKKVKAGTGLHDGIILQIIGDIVQNLLILVLAADK